MIGLLCFVLAVLASPFKSKLRLEAENAVLRHQLNVLRRKLHGRVRLTNHDRWFFIQLYRWFSAILKVLTIIRPETLVRWHRAGCAPRHEASNLRVPVQPGRPDHRPPGTIWLCYNGFLGDVDPFAIDLNAIVTVM
jgi:hypothetical protein